MSNANSTSVRLNDAKKRKTNADKPPNLAVRLRSEKHSSRPGWQYRYDGRRGRSKQGVRRYKGYLHLKEWNQIREETQDEQTQIERIRAIIRRKIWQPLFLEENARKLRSGDADAVISWLDECGGELQSDIDSVRVFFPDETPAFDVANFKQRITASIGDAAMLARLADEMLALDAAIRSTDDRLVEFIPDDLFDSDASVEEMGSTP